MEFSAAVFKNPVQSGRFIGQDWRRFSPWVQYLMPMDYRSHYAGDFETHLDLLAESIQQQKAWARDFPHLWPGVAAYQLYDEEREPLTRLRRLLRDGGKDVAEMQAAFDKVAPRLKTYAPDLHGALEAYLKEPKRPRGAGREARGLPRERAGGLLPAGAAHEDARARARPGRRGRRHLLVRRDHLGPPLEGGGGVLRPVVSSRRAGRRSRRGRASQRELGRAVGRD